MKKYLIGLILMLIGTNAIAKQYNNEQEFHKYLKEYGKSAALYELCGEPDMADIANIGIYFDEIITPKFLKQQIKKYGSQQKAKSVAVGIAEKSAKQEKYRLIDKGFSIDDCESLYVE